jgi:outer membrane receptor protein involved in Fe transport
LAFSPRPAFPEQTINSFNPKIAASYLLVTSADRRMSTRVHGSAGTGIRPPDAFEVSFTDNPNLKPERSRSLDVGVEQQLGGGLAVLGATIFFNTYDDLLVTVGSSLAGASQYRTDNVSNARARGLELSSSVRPHPSLVVKASYTFVDSEILSVDGLAIAPSPFKAGDALLRRPRHQGAVDATYAMGRVTAFAEITSRSQTLDVEPNFGSFGGLFFSPGYTVVNLGGAVRLVPHVEFHARVLNLADRQYEEAFGFPALGRSGVVGLRVSTIR